jgi:hypothetical protein
MKVGTWGCVLNETTEEYHLDVELIPAVIKEKVTAESIVKKARVKLVHKTWSEAYNDAKELSEAGGTKTVAVRRVRVTTEHVRQIVFDNGRVIEKNGQPHEHKLTRAERKNKEHE